MLRYFAFSVRDFGRIPDRSDYRLNWEIWIAFRGRARPVFHDDPRRNVAPANFWVIPPRLRLRWETQPLRMERAVFNYSQVPAALEALVRKRGFHSLLLEADDLEALRKVAMAVAEARRRPTTLSPLVNERALLDLTLLACRHEPVQPLSTLDTQVAERVEHALAWYKAHLHEHPKLEQVAAELQLSVSHLRRLFRHQYDKSPKAVLDGVRLEVSTTLMTSTRAPLKAIAAQAGFRSLADFTRVFKRHFGHPPNHWRKHTNRALVG
ncbi:MAG TPA: AraC family transcriptional regulator [Opitutaceae bacterium]